MSGAEAPGRRDLSGMRVLVTGGAGYVGAHVVLAALDAGLQVVVLDDLSTGFRSAVPEAAIFHQGSAADDGLVTSIVREHAPDAVLHFAARTVVSDSVADPLSYYRANTATASALFDACTRAGVRKLVMSSTAAVYGPIGASRVDESAPVGPSSPYGWSKAMAERMLQDAAEAGVLDAIILRYFNVAGADLAGRAGQSTTAATHLFKAACRAVLGVRPMLEVFGTDWPTRDGTGMRDYIDVNDLAQAHLAALAFILNQTGAHVFNLGTGRGHTVREVAAAVEGAAGRTLELVERPRRPGDVAAVVANPEKARVLLQWRARRELADTVSTALAWERRLALPRPRCREAPPDPALEAAGRPGPSSR